MTNNRAASSFVSLLVKALKTPFTRITLVLAALYGAFQSTLPTHYISGYPIGGGFGVTSLAIGVTVYVVLVAILIIWLTAAWHLILKMRE